MRYFFALFFSLAANFLGVRIYSLFRIAGLSAQDLFVGYMSDLVFTGIASLLFALPLSLSSRWLKKQAVPSLLLILFSFFTAILTHSYLEFFRFSGLYLSPSLFSHYFLQINYFAESLKTDNFAIGTFALLLGAWLVITIAILYAFRRITENIKLPALAAATLLLGAFCGLFFTDTTSNIRENFFSYYATYYIKPLHADTYPDTPQSPVEECLTSRYTYPEEQFPFMRTAKNPPPAPLIPITAKPRIILIFMESFAAKQLDHERNDGRSATPEFEKLKASGLYFANFYSNGVQTARGHFTTLCSQYDNLGPAFSTEYPENRISCLPHRLKEQGYRSLFMQGGSLKFDNQAESMKTMGFDTLIGLEEFPPRYSGDESGWGKNDETIFNYATELIAQATEPLFITIATITNHHPFEVPDKKFEKFSKETIQSRFLNTLAYSDYALGRFIAALQEKGLFENTILLITADHPQPLKEHRNNIMEISYAYEENFRIPLLVLAPGLSPAADTRIASQLDIMPTLLGILGITKKTETIRGENLLDPSACRYALMLQPFAERFSAVRWEAYKYLYNWQRKKGEIYDLTNDPSEQAPQTGLDAKARSLHNFMVNTIFSSNKALEENRLAPTTP